MNRITITLNTSFLTYVQSYWQEIQDDYRTLIGVTDVSNVVSDTTVNARL